jgi:poly(A) polymerase Pap1
MSQKDVVMVITCSKPFKNSAQHFSKSTYHILKEEFQRAHEICSLIQQNKEQWSSLFTKAEFFKEYKSYLCVTASALTQQEHMSLYALHSLTSELIKILELDG